MYRIACVVISDRGDLYLPDCLENLTANTSGLSTISIVDDKEHCLGMAGAVRAGWDWFLGTQADYLLHCEEDFRFNGPVPLNAMADVLDSAPWLAQVVLKRQPWSPEEHAAGGIIECHPDDYVDRDGFVEHDRIFSLNPCLIPRRVVEIGWPDDNEAGFTERCLNRGLSFAFFGARDDAPRVTHVGSVRGAGWRL